MDFDIPPDVSAFLEEVDRFIEDKIRPLEAKDDNMRFFDHRREDARTDWERQGLPNEEWESLLRQAKDLAIEAGIFNYPFPAEYGGRDGGNLGMAIIREHLAAKGLGLHNDLQNEHSVVGNNIGLLLMLKYGSDEQKAQWLDGMTNATRGFAFGITEPEHGSDATYMETSAVRDGDDWLISGEKTWNTGVHIADADMVMARTSGEPGDGLGITAFLIPMDSPGLQVEEYLWTFNMPSDHARVSFTDVRVPDSAIFGGEGKGLMVIQHFFNENRIRQAASSLGAAQYCVNEAVQHANQRKPFGKALASNQGIQFPLVELNTRCEMLRALIHKTAWLMDRDGAFSVSDKVSMCNYQANRLCCEAADFAMQVHGGMGYSRYKPFEHIYRHHRRYRITEGADEIQIRRAAGYLFGFMKQQKPKGSQLITMPEAFTTALEAVLSRELTGFRSLLSCQQLTAGASQETYRIRIEETAVDGGNSERQFALRRSQPSLDGDSSVGGISLATEARLFQMAGAAGIPGPAVSYVLVPGDGLGNGFIMEWLDGETLGQRIVRSEALAGIRPRLARECGQILGRIHALDWRAAGLAEHLPEVSPASLVQETWSSYHDLNVPVPMIDYTWRWLRDNLPKASRTTLVHGDFRNGNLMVTAQGINAVLDWELAQIGDPVRDLGWLCVNSWRFGNDALPVGGFGDVEDLLAGYRETSGLEIPRPELVFWQVFGSFWWAMATLQMANAWRTGETPSLERPVIGRRSSEAQMDCVNLLIPGEFSLPDFDKPISRGTGLPMPAELLAGVATFLKEDVATELDAHNGFLARVAANSLGIAQREFQCGEELAQQERQRLQALLGQPGDLDSLRWELVARLRADMPLDTPGLADHLRQSVAGQLAIDQPRYSALRVRVQQ